MIEANSRGLWDADEDTLGCLQALYGAADRIWKGLNRWLNSEL